MNKYLLYKRYKDGSISEEDFLNIVNNSHKLNTNIYFDILNYPKLNYQYITGINFDTQSLISIVKKYAVPFLYGKINPIFEKYGEWVNEVNEYWAWDDDKLNTAPEIDLWKMLAISNLYGYLDSKLSENIENAKVELKSSNFDIEYYDSLIKDKY